MLLSGGISSWNFHLMIAWKYSHAIALIIRGDGSSLPYPHLCTLLLLNFPPTCLRTSEHPYSHQHCDVVQVIEQLVVLELNLKSCNFECHWFFSFYLGLLYFAEKTCRLALNDIISSQRTYQYKVVCCGMSNLPVL